MAVLYRKYRPQNFSEVVGQQHVVQTLTNAISGKNISHAYLFCGPRGSGKTTIARLFAKAINCQNPVNVFEPCNKCSSCLEITSGNSIDVTEIDAATHTQVDKIRELIEGIRFSPVKSKYKIFVIDECHQLSKSASNALLKTLEEPPSHAIFILATTESHKILATILSRCQRFDFKKLQPLEIIKKLESISKKEKVILDESALSLIAVHSRGSFRDAESLLDQCLSFANTNGTIKSKDIEELLGIVESEKIAIFVDYLIEKDVKGAINFLNTLVTNGADLQEFVKSLIYYLRQGLILKIDSDFLNSQNSGLSAKDIEKLKQQIRSLSDKKIQDSLKIFIDAESKMKYASILQLPLELAVIELSTEQ